MFGKNILRNLNGNPSLRRQYKYLPAIHILDILALDVVLATRARIVETLFVLDTLFDILFLGVIGV